MSSRALPRCGRQPVPRSKRRSPPVARLDFPYPARQYSGTARRADLPHRCEDDAMPHTLPALLGGEPALTLVHHDSRRVGGLRHPVGVPPRHEARLIPYRGRTDARRPSLAEHLTLAGVFPPTHPLTRHITISFGV